ncbi:transglutaminase-like domain-containing protein [Sunxiuqinia sp. A32]|uniref:transglutaminase-like domain-containing protein n=1 Tax=Sunxiuqinia sp. A32 TaxID=3461496 RepID=UPI0040457415
MKIHIFTLIAITLLLTSCATFFRAINYSPSNKMKEITFTEESPNTAYHFYYSDTLNHSYLRELRQKYKLDNLAATASSEMEKIKAILNWSSSQWSHNGSNSPSNADALTILKEAKNGSQFRCVEYGILASACLNSVGLRSRVLGLKTRDVEKVKKGAAHVVTEVYSKKYNKWIFIDPQFNILPTKNGTPLNAVEFQKAILSGKEDIELVNINGAVDADFSENYLQWIGKYLYYFDVLFDQRIGYELDYKDFDGKTKLMLVPAEAENPTVFQRNNKINYCIYTNSISDFYRNPMN